MKRQIAMLLVGLFVGAMLFGSTVQAQGPTTEERLRKLESVVNGDTGSFQTAEVGERFEIDPSGAGTRLSWFGEDNLIDAFIGQNADYMAITAPGGIFVNGAGGFTLTGRLNPRGPLVHEGPTAGFYGSKPVHQPSMSYLGPDASADEARRKFNNLVAHLRSLGLIGR